MVAVVFGVPASALLVGLYLGGVFVGRRRPPGGGRPVGWADLPAGVLALSLVLATLQAALAMFSAMVGDWAALPWHLVMELLILAVPAVSVRAASQVPDGRRRGPEPPSADIVARVEPQLCVQR
jgi:hypothetical protein